MAENLSKLIQALNDAGYTVGINGKGQPTIKNFQQLKAANPTLWARVNASKDALRSKLTTEHAPAILQARDKGALAVARRYINSGNEAINEGISQLGQIPDARAEALSKVLGFMTPQSATGKMTALATLPFGGEEGFTAATALKRAVPPLVGAATGYLSGEGTLQGAGQGAVASAAMEAGKIPGAIGKLGRWMKKPSLVEKVWDRGEVGQVLAQVLDHMPKTANRLREAGSNWVKVLRGLPDNLAGREAGQYYEEGIESVLDAAKARAKDMINEAREAFRDRWGTEFSRPVARTAEGRIQGRAANDQMFAEARQLKQNMEEIWNGPKRIRSAINSARRLRAKAYDQMGRVRGSVAGQEAAEAYARAQNDIHDALNAFDKGGYGAQLGDAYDAIKDSYKRFAALRDLADLPQALSKYRDKINAQGLQDFLTGSENPDYLRGIQRRLGESWDAVHGSITRWAKEAEGIDRPGMLERMRLIGSPTTGHMHALMPIGEALAGGPVKSKLVGEVPGLLPKQPPVSAPTLSRISGLLGNKAVDTVLGATGARQTPAAEPSEE